MKREYRVHIVCECSERFRDDIKRRADLRHMTMKSYILQAIINEFRREDESDNIHDNDTIGVHRPRI